MTLRRFCAFAFLVSLLTAGTSGGDSNCSYYMHPGGSSVLTCD